MSLSYRVTNAEETRAWGAQLAQILRPGDVVLLCGELGAGKTTLAQGIGRGLGVRGQVSSPTFIVARVHPPETGSYPMIHVDAYRITDLNDLETLDLDSSLEEAITLVEWGQGKVEALSENRLEVEVQRQIGGMDLDPSQGTVDLTQADDGQRVLQITPIGERWQELNWSEIFSGAAQVEV